MTRPEVLTRPFPPEQVRQRPGQHGKMLSYVETWAVIERLNEGCDSWSFVVEKYEVLDGEVLVLGKLTADGVIKTAFGGSSITTDKVGGVISIADDMKAAASDSLKKCASLFGVGLELYGAQRACAELCPSETQASSTATEARLTTRQLAAIHSASRRRGLSQQGLTAFLHGETGKSDVNALTKREASNVISALSGSNGGAH